MDSYPWVLVVGLAVAAVIAALMIWRGLGGEITMGSKGLHIGIRPRRAAADEVNVASAADIAGEVGTIIGDDRRELRSDGHRPRRTIVAKGMVVRRGGKVGSIVGRRSSKKDAAAESSPK